MVPSIATIRFPLVLALLLGALPAQAQRMPEAFLGLAPSLPSGTCGASQAQRKEFGAKIRELNAAIDKEMKRRTQERKAREQELRRKIGDSMAGRAGVTPGEAQAIEAGGPGGKAAADAALRRQTGMSMEELKAMKGMSKEQRKAWAMSHAGQIGANAPPSPPAGQSARVIELQRQIADLVATQAKKKERLDKRRAELDEVARPIMGQLRTDAEKQEFCERYSPQLRAIISDYLGFTHGLIPETYRLEEMESESTRLSTGVDPQIEPGTAGLPAVRSYLLVLSTIFQYDLVEH